MKFSLQAHRPWV